MLEFVVKNGTIDRQALLQLLESSSVVAEARHQSWLRQGIKSICREPKGAFTTSIVACQHRRNAKKSVVDMMLDAEAMGFGERLANEINLQYVPDQEFGRGVPNG